MSDIRDRVRRFIVDDIAAGHVGAGFTDDTPLRASGILDSLSTLKLVTFLEEQFDLRFEVMDLDEEHLSSVSSIERLVQSKAVVPS